jgi:hypothetical protein
MRSRTRSAAAVAALTCTALETDVLRGLLNPGETPLPGASVSDR